MSALLRIIFFVVVIKPILLLLLGINVFGREHLPKNQQFILIANHNSHLDAVALMDLFPLSALHRIHPVAASDYFLKNKFVAWFTQTFLNILPIPRSNFSKNNNPLMLMGNILNKGHSLILFPEGTRGNPEEMAPFQAGVAHLIKKNPEIPVIPVFLKGMGRSLPKGEIVLLPFFCDVIIGHPRYFTGSKEEIIEQVQESVFELQKTLSRMLRLEE